MLSMRTGFEEIKRIGPDLAALLTGLLLTGPSLTLAAQDIGSQDRANNDVGDIASLQRGARNFVNYCLGCHSAKYVRYNRLADDLGITEDQLINNLMFVTEKPHDTMRNSMPPDDAERWFGQAPPDLSLIARSRGPDFLYRFLRSFYLDDSRPTGVNNLVIDSVAMPHVLWELQGMQRAVFEEKTSASGRMAMIFRYFEPATKRLRWRRGLNSRRVSHTQPAGGTATDLAFEELFAKRKTMED